MFYVKPNSNCEGLPLTSLSSLLSGQWSKEIWRGRPTILTGENLSPRQVVGWSSLFGESAVDIHSYIRLDGTQIALLGGDWGVRILANEDEANQITPSLGCNHLPLGWGTPILTIEDPSDICDANLRTAIETALSSTPLSPSFPKTGSPPTRPRTPKCCHTTMLRGYAVLQSLIPEHLASYLVTHPNAQIITTGAHSIALTHHIPTLGRRDAVYCSACQHIRNLKPNE